MRTAHYTKPQQISYWREQKNKPHTLRTSLSLFLSLSDSPSIFIENVEKWDQANKSHGAHTGE